MRTYDYILAMKEENQSMELDPFDDSDISSDESTDFDSPEKTSFVSRFVCKGCRGNQVRLSVKTLYLIFASSEAIIPSWILLPVDFQNPPRLSIRIDRDPEPSTSSKKQGFRVSIDPWKLVKLSREKALIAAEKARERLMKQKPTAEHDSLKPLPLETKSGPLMNTDRNLSNAGTGSTPLILKGRHPASPGSFSSPRRRFSGSPTMFSGIVASPKQKYRGNFDLKLTEVSRELENYISRQVLCSVIKKDGSEASPR